jgi:hypothetical protein
MTDQWINERLVLLRSLKTLNDHQRLLLMLADKWPRTTHDERKLAALVKAEKAAERAEKARNSASCIIDQEKLTERKTRNHRAILKGALIDWTVLEGKDRGELLGALLEFAENGTPDDRSRWKHQGDALISRRQPPS